MLSLTHAVTVGSLLHDIGKIIYRAEVVDNRAHSKSGSDFVRQFTDNKYIIDCVGLHHRKDLRYANLEKNSPAYIVYIADNISSGLDRREIEGESIEGFKKDRPLASIYNLLNNKSGKEVHAPKPIAASPNYPQTDPLNSSSDYNEILSSFRSGLSGIFFEEQYVNSLMDLCEAYFSFIPASTYGGQVPDIPLYDHSKTTAALASCIALYLEGFGENDYYKELYEKEKEFYDKDVFCILSLDISGIQQFIYNISSKGALKGLRSRSFYLEILLENTVDELLSTCSLSRANLLYTGGGHAYILLPNITEILEKVENALKCINLKLLKLLGTGLFVSYGLQKCSASELMSKTENPEDYINIFRSVSAQIAAMKLRRYSPDDIRHLNRTDTDKEGLECSVCGTSGDLKERGDSIICSICCLFADISSELIKPDIVFAVLRDRPDEPSLPLISAHGSDLHLKPMTDKTALEFLKSTPGRVVRLYSKNSYRTGLSLASKLWIGDYAAKGSDGALKTFIELANESSGVKRIGILRVDVDDLGSAFLRGFIRDNDTTNKYKYLTVSRITALSRSLSLFFKYHINSIVENPIYTFIPKTGKRNAVIVYAGGDDMFIAGAWDEVLSAAVDIRRAFNQYTGGALTVSAGFGIFDEKYPIHRMAEETTVLEERAKQNRYAGGAKNSISLFGLELEDDHLIDKHTYDWDTFEAKVLGEKMGAFNDYTEAGGSCGNAFLYNILNLIRQAGAGINIARLAYLLARHEPPRGAPGDVKTAYSRFSNKLYQWALDPEDRRQSVTAIMIYVYSKRESKGGENHE